MYVVRLLCILLLLIPNIATTSFLEPEYWDSACHPDAPASSVGWIIEWIGEPSFTNACEVYISCESQNAAQKPECYVPVYESIYTDCDDAERFCKLQAAHATASLLQNNSEQDALALLAYPIVIATEVNPPTDTLFTVRVDEVLEIAAERTSFNGSNQAVLYLAAGAAYEFVNDTETAAKIYTQGLSLGNDPLLLYRRGLLYGGQGKVELAAIDGFVLSTLATSQPTFEGIAILLKSQYPLDESRLQGWNVYDELVLNYTVAGDSIRDLSTTPPRPVLIGRYVNDTILLLVEETANYGISIDIYQQISPDTFYTIRPTSIDYLTFMDNTAFRSTLFETFEAGGYRSDRLASIEAPDPRPQYPRCDNGGRWYLKVGDEGYFVDNVYQESIVYEAPGGQVSVKSLRDFEVVDGPVCIQGTAWWGVRDLYGKETPSPTYWLPEAEGDPTTGFYYNLSTRSLKNSYCPGALLSSLYPGVNGYVVQDIDSLALHVDPYPASEVLTTIASGESFNVGTASTCYERIIWWYVDYNGTHGWIQSDNGTIPFVSR